MIERETKRIEKLPENTRTYLRSTQILTSIPQIVSELVQNSLDAQASHIDVGINYEEWTCFVSDDGVGISNDGLSMLAKGGEQGRYASSKDYEPSSGKARTFGFRGEALASLGDLSCLEISSRVAKSSDTWSIIVKGDKCLHFGSASRWRRSTPGTVVCVREAFYNIPVRRSSHVDRNKAFDQVQKAIESFALVFPEVTFTLDDSARSKQDIGKGRVFTVPKTGSSLACFSRLFGRSLVESVECISAVSEELELNGFISCEGSQSKGYQYFYVNRHPMKGSDFQRVVERCFSLSSFSKWANDEMGEDSLARKGSRRSPRKVERWPVYVLNLTVPQEEVDNLLEPTKSTILVPNAERVAAFLTEVVGSFLKRCGFSNPGRQKRPRDTSSSPSKRRQPSEDHEDAPIQSRHAFTDTPKPRLSDESRLPPLADPKSAPEDDTQEQRWTDPATGQTFLVDMRAGNSYPIHNDPRKEALSQPPSRRVMIGGSVGSRPSFSRLNPISSRDALPEWIKTAFEQNNTFMSDEAKINAVKQAPTGNFDTLQTCEDGAGGKRFGHARNSPYFSISRTSDLSQSFTATELQDAHVICQIDKKFIACLIPPGPKSQNKSEINGGTLILIDQHAADERVRVERYLKELCLGYLQGNMELAELKPPQLIVLTKREGSLLMDPSGVAVKMLVRWGINIRSPTEIGESSPSTESFLQFSVDSVPELLVDKLRVGQELQQLIRNLVIRFEEDDALLPVEPRTSSGTNESSWLTALHRCPKDLVDLVNSKACRGAIMFNDTLHQEQCERLVKQLGSTAFPFQCAHGRPSMIPLVALSGTPRGGSDSQNSHIDWTGFTGAMAVFK